MAPTVKIVENFVAKKRRVRGSKNRGRAAWRKNDLKDIETSLIEREEEDRLGVLGEDTKNMFILDHDPDAPSEIGDVPEVPLEYTIDVGSGLKETGKKIEQKTIAAHKFLDGLPGKKPVKQSSRFREQHTELFKDQKLQAKLARNEKFRLKQEHKAVIDKVTEKESKTVSKLSKKRRTDTDAWGVKELSKSELFVKDAMDYTMEMMKKRPIKRRSAIAKPKKIASVPLPHGGQSYNPTFAAHQELLHQAVHQENKKVEKLKVEGLAKGTNFPLGALPANIVEALEDMEPQDQHTVHKEGGNEVTMEDIVISRPGRSTKKERLDKKRKIRKEAKQKQDTKKQDLLDDFDNIEGITKEINKRTRAKKFRAKVRKIKIERRNAIPARYFKEPGTEVALGDELVSNLRTIKKSSFASEATFDHIFRRGLLPNKAKKHSKVGRSALRLLRTRSMKAKQLDPFTPEQFFGKEEAKKLVAGNV